MNSKFENKVVQVDEGVKYYIIKELELDGKTYLIANELVSDAELSENVYVLRVEGTEDVSLAVETDLTILQNVLTKAAELIS